MCVDHFDVVDVGLKSALDTWVICINVVTCCEEECNGTYNDKRTSPVWLLMSHDCASLITLVIMVLAFLYSGHR